MINLKVPAQEERTQGRVVLKNTRGGRVIKNTSVQHGTLTMYGYDCRCGPCVDHKRAHDREYKASKYVAPPVEPEPYFRKISKGQMPYCLE